MRAGSPPGSQIRDAVRPPVDRPSARPRLLFLCQTLPYPPDGGVSIRTYNVLRILARDYAITGLCFFRAKDRPTDDDVQTSLSGLRALGDVEVEAFPIPQEQSRWRLVWDHVRSLVTQRAYTRYAYESAAFRSRLNELLRGPRFDLVHVDSLDLVAYLPVLCELPVVCVHHNVESSLLRRRARSERGLRRFYMSYQASLLKSEERRWCPRVVLNVTVSPEDRAHFRRLAPGAEYAVVPNAVDIEAFRPLPGKDEGIVCVGGTNWYPNRDALSYLVDDILPRIRALGDPGQVRWVGRATRQIKSLYAGRGIELTGYVQDVRPYLRDAACVVIPLRVGGGTRLKILDAWAMGKAVVSTSIGCEGLRAADGRNILVRDTPDDFAAAVHQLLSDHQLRKSLGEHGRETVERHYSWEVLGPEMLARYRAVRHAWKAGV